MAVPIALVPRTPESREEIAERLDQAQIDHAKAILAAYELLQALHDAKVLDIARGMVTAKDPIAVKLSTALGSEDVINAVRNFISLTKIMGSIDSDFLNRLAHEICEERPGRHPIPSLWGTVRAFVSKDSRRAVAGTVAFIRAFGKALAEPGTK